MPFEPIFSSIFSSPFGAGFNPASVFAAGDVGWVYDTQNLASMFQDVAGATPANQPGHPVGLRLDTKHGLALGPELFVGGNGTDTTGWTGPTGSGSFVSSGGLFILTAASPIAIFTDRVASKVVSGLVIGRTYKLTGAIRNINAVGAGAQLSVSGLGIASTLSTTSQTLRLIFTATATIHAVQLLISGGSGAQIEADNISVRELPGIHASQSVAASRPTLARRPASGVRNLLANTDAMATQSVTVSAVAHTLSFTGTGTVTLSGASTAGPLVGTGAGNRVSLTFTPTAGSLTMTVTGSVTFGQLELGAFATAYQRVGSIYDVTEAGQPDRWCLVTDGVDDGMVTPTITPAVGADKVQVVAGVRKLSDATSVIVELSSDRSSNLGAFTVLSNTGVSFASRGSLLPAAISSGAIAPGNAAVVTGLGDIVADSAVLRVNGAQVASSAVDQGTGQFGTYPAYLYRRAGTSLPAKVEDYRMICRISTTNLTPAQIGQLEAWANQPTGAY